MGGTGEEIPEMAGQWSLRSGGMSTQSEKQQLPSLGPPRIMMGVRGQFSVFFKT